MPFENLGPNQAGVLQVPLYQALNMNRFAHVPVFQTDTMKKASKPFSVVVVTGATAGIGIGIVAALTHFATVAFTLPEAGAALRRLIGR